ncbi:hypothetical protein DXG03_006815, partial [Asterophora parasitica]
MDPAKTDVNDGDTKPSEPVVELAQPPPPVDIAVDSTPVDPLARAPDIQAPSATTEVTKLTRSTTRLHISKRAPPSAAPVGRVTRSVSQKRNMNAPEVPKPVPRKLPAKQTLARKKPISAEPVAGPSSQLADVIPQQD